MTQSPTPSWRVSRSNKDNPKEKVELINKKLKEIPKDIGDDTVYLFLNRNPLNNPNLETLHKLKVLHLDSTGISSLKGAYDQPSLEEITFANTPFADLRYSRLMCALAFYPNLRKVNGVEISEKEKRFCAKYHEDLRLDLFDGLVLTKIREKSITLYNPATKKYKRYYQSENPIKFYAPDTSKKSLISKPAPVSTKIPQPQAQGDSASIASDIHASAQIEEEEYDEEDLNQKPLINPNIANFSSEDEIGSESVPYTKRSQTYGTGEVQTPHDAVHKMLNDKFGDRLSVNSDSDIDINDIDNLFNQQKKMLLSQSDSDEYQEKATRNPERRRKGYSGSQSDYSSKGNNQQAAPQQNYDYYSDSKGSKSSKTKAKNATPQANPAAQKEYSYYSDYSSAAKPQGGGGKKSEYEYYSSEAPSKQGGKPAQGGNNPDYEYYSSEAPSKQGGKPAQGGNNPDYEYYSSEAPSKQGGKPAQGGAKNQEYDYYSSEVSGKPKPAGKPAQDGQYDDDYDYYGYSSAKPATKPPQPKGKNQEYDYYSSEVSAKPKPTGKPQQKGEYDDDYDYTGYSSAKPAGKPAQGGKDQEYDYYSEVSAKPAGKPAQGGAKNQEYDYYSSEVSAKPKPTGKPQQKGEYDDDYDYTDYSSVKPAGKPAQGGKDQEYDYYSEVSAKPAASKQPQPAQGGKNDEYEYDSYGYSSAKPKGQNNDQDYSDYSYTDN